MHCLGHRAAQWGVGKTRHTLSQSAILGSPVALASTGASMYDGGSSSLAMCKMLHSNNEDDAVLLVMQG